MAHDQVHGQLMGANDGHDCCITPSIVAALSICCQEGCREDVILTMQDYWPSGQ